LLLDVLGLSDNRFSHVKIGGKREMLPQNILNIILHLIEFERVRYPICIAGKGACPPEDCGGVFGYANLLDIIQDPQNPEYDDMNEWLGGKFDPEAFDIDKINKSLAEVKL
jgi:hypothetical protein